MPQPELASFQPSSAKQEIEKAELPDLLKLPYDYYPEQTQDYQKNAFRFHLDALLVEKIRLLADRQEVPKSVVFLTGFGVLLSKYSLQDEFLIGIPVKKSQNGSSFSSGKSNIGILPLHYTVPETHSFREGIAIIKEQFMHSEYREIKSVLFNYLSEQENEINAPWLNEHLLNGALKAARMDILLTVLDYGDNVECAIEYNSGLFLPETISRMGGHYTTLLKAVSDDENIPILKIPLLTDAESTQILKTWNETSRSYPKDKCMHQLVEEQVLKTPDSIAVIHEDKSATFDELNRRANQLAHYLVRLGAGEDKIVAFCLERGIDMLVTLLAISKTGAAYLPVDPIFPRERQESILNDAKPVLFITQSSLFDKDFITDAKIILFDNQNLVKGEPEDNLSLGNPDCTLYIIYTSGSTGKPKGVSIRHNSTVNVVKAMSRHLGITDKDVIFTVTTIAFDMAETDIYISLLSGARLVIGTCEAAMCMEFLITELEARHATFFAATPVTYRMLIRAGWKGKPDLKILCGGDAMTRELGSQLLCRCQEVWNCWGPTETTIYNTTKKVTPEDVLGNGIVSLGKALDNNTFYVVNQGMVPVPVGIGGEVYIGVTGISPGYLNRPELTKEKFIPNPFGNQPSDILYKSGDLVKYLPDGNLAFISRVDTQVKIRGFRIELEEIESVMLRYNGIRETVVIARGDFPGEKKLVAYYTQKKDAEITHCDLRRFLSEKLPEYMIPAAFIRMDALPLTASKKINRKALPIPPASGMESNTDFNAPVTELENRLVAIWKDVLEIPRISTNMDFFEAGGHSLTATLVLSKVKHEFHVELPFRVIFKNFTIRELARRIEQFRADQTDGATQPEIIQHKTSATDVYPLSSSQRRIWFLETLNETIRAYDIPLDFKITGDLNSKLLNSAINILISRHEAFRTVFPDIQGEPVQKVLPELKCDLEIINLQNLPKEKMAEIISHRSLENSRYKFHLATGPLFRFQILVLGESESILLINFHHIIFDAVSVKIFLDELKKVYDGLVNDTSPDLPVLPVTYSDYSCWQNEWLKGDECKRQLAFLKTELTGVNDILQLPLDFPRPRVQTYHGAEFHFTLDSGLKNKLIAISKKENASLAVSLLTAFAILLHRYSLQDDFVIGFPVANRMHPELETMIGVFINSLPLRFTFPTDVSFSEMTVRTMKKFLSAYENQEVPFEGLVEEMKVKRSLNVNPIFQVLFNYLAVIPGEIEMQGVKS
jgi:amino acid adenylation domain-containing protein